MAKASSHDFHLCAIGTIYHFHCLFSKAQYFAGLGDFFLHRSDFVIQYYYSGTVFASLSRCRIVTNRSIVQQNFPPVQQYLARTRRIPPLASGLSQGKLFADVPIRWENEPADGRTSGGDKGCRRKRQRQTTSAIGTATGPKRGNSAPTAI